MKKSLKRKKRPRTSGGVMRGEGGCLLYFGEGKRRRTSTRDSEVCIAKVQLFLYCADFTALNNFILTNFNHR